MEYLLQNHHAGYVGNAPMFWARGGGYTAYIDNAERFTDEESMKIIDAHSGSGKFSRWEVGYIESISHRVVDMQQLRRKNAEPQHVQD